MHNQCHRMIHGRPRLIYQQLSDHILNLSRCEHKQLRNPEQATFVYPSVCWTLSPVRCSQAIKHDDEVKALTEHDNSLNDNAVADFGYQGMKTWSLFMLIRIICNVTY